MGGRALHLSGRILANDDERVAAVLRQVGPVEEATFDPGGGSVRAGVELGRLLRRAGIATRIAAGHECASACLFAFAGGWWRRVEPGGRVGLHRATLTRRDERVAAVAAAARKGEAGAVETALLDFERTSYTAAAAQAMFLVEMGLSLRLMVLHARTEPGDMHWLTAAELRDLNVVNDAE
jgi:hypothetical protein